MQLAPPRFTVPSRASALPVFTSKRTVLCFLSTTGSTQAFLPVLVESQNERPTATKGIQLRRRVAIRRFQNFLARLLKHMLIVRVLPLHQLLDNPKEPLPFRFLGRLGRELFRMARRVIHERGKEHCAARRQR